MYERRPQLGEKWRGVIFIRPDFLTSRPRRRAAPSQIGNVGQNGSDATRKRNKRPSTRFELKIRVRRPRKASFPFLYEYVEGEPRLGTVVPPPQPSLPYLREYK